MIVTMTVTMKLWQSERNQKIKKLRVPLSMRMSVSGHLTFNMRVFYFV